MKDELIGCSHRLHFCTERDCLNFSSKYFCQSFTMATYIENFLLLTSLLYGELFFVVLAYVASLARACKSRVVHAV